MAISNGYDTQALYKIYAKVKTTDADPVIILSSILCMISAHVKLKIYIPESNAASNDNGYFQRLYPNLWVLSISKSGTFKSTALNKGFKLAHIHDADIGDDEYMQSTKVLLPFYRPLFPRGIMH